MDQEICEGCNPDDCQEVCSLTISNAMELLEYNEVFEKADDFCNDTILTIGKIRHDHRKVAEPFHFNSDCSGVIYDEAVK